MEDCILDDLKEEFEGEKDLYIDSKSKLAGYLLLEKSLFHPLTYMVSKIKMNNMKK